MFLFLRWEADEPVNAQSQRHLPVDTILSRCLGKDGCPGLCNRCGAEALVRFWVKEMPPILLLHVGPFMR